MMAYFPHGSLASLAHQMHYTRHTASYSTGMPR